MRGERYHYPRCRIVGSLEWRFEMRPDLARRERGGRLPPRCAPRAPLGQSKTARSARAETSGTAASWRDPLAAKDDASVKTVVHRTIRACMDADLDRNPGLKERYEELRRARREGRVANVRLIKLETPASRKSRVERTCSCNLPLFNLSHEP